MLDWTATRRSGSCPRNGIRPKRLFNICERLNSTPAKAWPCSTPAGSSASRSKDARSASQRGTVLHAERSPDHHRTLEDSLQHGPSAQQSRGPATRSRNYPAGELRTNMVGGIKTPGWAKHIRRIDLNQPVIILTGAATSETEQQVRALEAT